MNISTFFAFLCFAFLAVTVLAEGIASPPAHSTEDTAYTHILRLHVVANSDRVSDQSLKYKVRDEILPLLVSLTEKCKNPATALEAVEKNKALIEKTASKVVNKSGEKQNVRLETGVFRYPEKEYGGRSYPEGSYLSVRILLGDGAGQNWWCVLFPSLRQIGTAYEEKKDSSAGIELFGCRIKLKIRELFE